MTEEQKGWLRLHLARGLGRAALIRLREAFGGPGEALAASPEELIRRAGIREEAARGIPAADDPAFLKTLERLEGDGVRLISLWDEDYPPLLRAIFDPPALLYLRGKPPAGEALAVVGSRAATEAGRSWTAALCAELAAAGIAIVSGLARGIDTAAHQGALTGGGLTIGVLGCGIDRVYPPENARLFQRILEEGGILTEYSPGTPPLAGHFPGRNRIISGLCRGVLVVEAAEESGSLITADFALEQGREVFAVPGPVHGRTSAGPHRLIKEGATLVTGAADILAQLWPATPPPGPKGEPPELPPEALLLWHLLGPEPLHVDELVARSGLTPMEVSDILLHLELAGEAEQRPGMRFSRPSRS